MQRDDASIERAALYTQTGRPERALALLTARRFQPWEGGEGLTLAEFVRASLASGRQALANRDPARALALFQSALQPPESLGEARHLLANASNIHYWLGVALAANGDRLGARQHWTNAATLKGDFQEMSIRTYSETTYYSALACRALGREGQALRLFRALRAYAQNLRRLPAKIDYFATSLPTLLLFEDDLTQRQHTTALFLLAQAELGLGRVSAARRLLRAVLQRDPSHAGGADLLAETQALPP